MRWVLVVFVVLVLIALWVAAAFFPELRWFAQLLTALVVFPIVSFLVFVWGRAWMRRAAAPKPAPLASAGKQSPAARLRSHFRRALGELRRVLGGRGAVRRVPWYVALGPPGTGVSTMLDRLGLSLMAAPAVDRVQGERAPCDLRASREAVVVDAPARLAEEDERDAWVALLDEVRRARFGRSLEGAVVAVSVPSLLSGTENDLLEWGARIRGALELVVERLEVALPVYLVVTKADALPGFAEFWENDPKADDSAWGASFAVDDEAAIREPARAVERELDVLAEALHARMLQRVAMESDGGRRVRVLRFPLELRAVTAPLARFVEALCRPGAAAERFFFRGFYLTSAGAEGSPAPQVDRRWAGAQAPREPKLRGHFLVDVLRSVVLPDRNLAVPTATSLRRRSKFDLRISLIAVAVAFLVLAPALASYVHNIGVAQDCQAAGEGLAGATGDVAPGMRADPIEPALDTLARVEEDARSFGIAGWFGPRAATELREPLADAYVRRIHAWMMRRLRPSLDKELERIAWGPPLADRPTRPDESTPLRDAYETVRLVSALVNPKGHVSGEWAAKRLAYHWRAELGAADVVEAPRLVEHARRYLAALEAHPQWAWAAGPSLVSARTQLRRLNVQDLPYRRLLLWGRDETPVRASVIFAAATLPFLDSPGNLQVDGVYTANGWQRIRDALRAPAPWPPEAVVERWAMDDATLPADDPQLRERMRKRYFEDYVQQWMDFFGKLKVRGKPPDTATAKAELVALKEADGFYRTLFTQFKVNTIHDEDAEALTADAGSWFSKLWPGKSEVDAGAKPAQPTYVETSFRPLLVFAGEAEGEKSGGGGPSPLDKYLAILDKLKEALDEGTAPTEVRSGPYFEASNGVRQLLDSVPQSVRGPLGDNLLWPPVNGAKVVSPGPTSADWATSVWPKCDQLTGRFPFRGSAVGEAVTWDEFTDFFKQDGILWGFVHKYLMGRVELSGDGRWTVARGADNPLPANVLVFLTQAQEVTNAFFHEGEAPGLKFSVQADWTEPDVTDTKLALEAKDTPLPKAQWSTVMLWMGEKVRVEWTQGGRPTQELGRRSFSLFDLFAQFGGLRSSAGHAYYTLECPPLSLKVRSDARADAFRSDFFQRMHCPPNLQNGSP
jgi:type VI secretion system protein ImpL